MLKKTMFATTFFSTGFAAGAFLTTAMFALGVAALWQDQKEKTPDQSGNKQPVRVSASSVKKDPEGKFTTTN